MEGLGTVLLITAAAGIGGTGFGGGAACLLRRDSGRAVSLMLSFAAGVMTAVVCFDLLADAAQAGLLRAVLGVLAGYGGTEALNAAVSRADRRGRSSLFLAGVVMAAAIAVHNMPEGMVIGASFSGAAGSLRAGLMMAAVIGLHNIPEGMAVGVPLISGGMRRCRAVLVCAATGAPTVLGAAVGYFLGTLGPRALSLALSFASGAMLYVVFGELLPEAGEMWKSRLPALAAVVGMMVGMAIVYA